MLVAINTKENSTSYRFTSKWLTTFSMFKSKSQCKYKRVGPMVNQLVPTADYQSEISEGVNSTSTVRLILLFF